ncbi:MAG TPA: prepilin-type N-terminal cleavage/methylation domain-containing protein [Polyangiales bacterium]|nr:prepilin-type N-terminal cleavage/methylation domain-containing protein [Polyangiales bacterium]
MSRLTKSKPRAGFTLLEIMVSLTVGGIALSSIYAIGAASTRHFREQQRISSAQTSLRAAMATLKHDFQRAGFMSTPNSKRIGEACSEPANIEDNRVAAVNRYAQNATKPSKLDPDGLNPKAGSFYTVDDVWLTANYETSGEYPNISVSPDGYDVSVPMGWQSFQRDFSEWSGTAAANCNSAVFQQVFAEDRLVRLHGQNGTFFYSRIARTNCVGDSTSVATISLRDAVPNTCSMNGGWIAPVNTYRYRVVDAETVEDDAYKRVTVLRRTEVTAELRTKPLEASNGIERIVVEDRSLLDYVVRFKVDFLGMFGKVSHVAMTEPEVQNFPELIRGVVLDVAVRTPQQEPDFTSDVPRSAFKVFVGTGAARVRRLRAELLLPNIANRNINDPP